VLASFSPTRYFTHAKLERNVGVEGQGARKWSEVSRRYYAVVRDAAAVSTSGQLTEPSSGVRTLLLGATRLGVTVISRSNVYILTLTQVSVTPIQI